MNADQDARTPTQDWISLSWSESLRHPSMLLLLAANFVPIYGVLHWGWDMFLLLMLYGLETAIIGFWTILRIITLPPASFGDMARPGTRVSPVVVAAFFVVHSGIFVAAYIAFLWSWFSGDWPSKIHGPVDFLAQLVIDTGLWMPLFVLFVVRGLAFVFSVIRPQSVERIWQRLGFLHVPKRPISTPKLGTVVGGYYTRIIIMQLTILACGFLAKALGTITPLVLMIIVKTIADGILQVKFDFGGQRKVTASG